MTQLSFQTQPQQVQICEQTPKRRTQADRVLALLRSKEWVTLPEILDLRIANYRARISELRRRGYWIECYVKQVNGEKRTEYNLTLEPADMEGDG